MVRTVLIAALLFACNKKDDPGPSCDQVVDHMLELTKAMLPGHEGMNGLGDRKKMIDQCVERAMPKATRQCLLDAKSFEALGACRKGAGPSRARAVPPPPSPGPTGSGSAAGSGSAGSGSG